MGLERGPAGPEPDDDVHFGVAAKALGVSRKTVERMVKNKALARGPSGAAATVSKRALVAHMEERRGRSGSVDLAALDGSPAPVPASSPAAVPLTTEAESQLAPFLEPLITEVVEARAQSALVESQKEALDRYVDRERQANELMLALITGNWIQRRKARRYATRVLLGRRTAVQKRQP